MLHALGADTLAGLVDVGIPSHADEQLLDLRWVVSNPGDDQFVCCPALGAGNLRSRAEVLSGWVHLNQRVG